MGQSRYSVGNQCFIAATLSVVVSVSLSACGGSLYSTNTSIDARELQFETPSYVPAPRSIQDITAIFDREAEDESATLSEARIWADLKPGTAANLTGFYRKRGLAAAKVGRGQQYVDDYREALKLAREGTEFQFADLLVEASVAEQLGGNFSESLKLRLEALDYYDAYNSPQGMAILGVLITRLQAASGNLTAAQAALSTAEGYTSGVGATRSMWPTQSHSKYPGTKYDGSNSAVRGVWSIWGEYLTGMLHYSQSGLALAEGRFPDAEVEARAALARMAESKSTPRMHGYYWPVVYDLHQDLALALMHQGRLGEAEVEARTAVRKTIDRTGASSLETAQAVVRALIPVLMEQGRYSEAEQLSRATIELFRHSGVSESAFNFTRARAERADALAYERRWDEAMAEFTSVKAALVNDPVAFDRFIRGKFNFGAALIESGKTDEADAILSEILRHRESRLGDDHFVTNERRGLYAVALTRAGRRSEAKAQFERAIPPLLRSLEFPQGITRARQHRARYVLEGYLDFLASDSPDSVKESTAQEAFRIADIIRGQSVSRALTASAARAAAHTPELSDLAWREQEVAREVTAHHIALAQVTSLPEGVQGAAEVESLRARIKALIEERELVLGEIEAKFPKYADLVAPKPVSVEDIREHLMAGEALVATYSTWEWTHVWVIPKGGELGYHAVPMGRAELDGRVTEIRRALDSDATSLDEIPRFDVAAAHDLYRRLLKPLKRSLRRVDSILVASDRSLSQLPFAVFPLEPPELQTRAGELFAEYRQVRWLIHDYAVTSLPSAASIVTLRRDTVASLERQPFVGFGDPWFSVAQANQATGDSPVMLTRVQSRGLKIHRRSAPRTRGVETADLAMLPPLPETGEEVRAIAVTLGADPAKDLYLGARASEAIVKSSNLFDRRVLAFATHGLAPGDLNGLSEPALALSSPEVVGDDEDGLLTASEILGLRLNADWVILSACNTGSGNGVGSEAVSGLGRAFFYAGARALLVSHWPVETTSARTLTTELFSRHTRDIGISRAEALRRTMLSMIQDGDVRDSSGKVLFTYAHPIFWAPFSLIGDGGGAK